MTLRTGVSSSTPGNIMIDAGAVYLNYGLINERLLGATRGGNEFNLNRVTKNIEVDGIKGAVKGLKRVTEINPQITANLIELTVDNLIAAIAGANQADRGYIESEYVGVGDGAIKEFDLNQNDVVENSERIYKSDAAGALALLTRSAKYDSRFVGVNAADNKEFEAGTGNWAKGNAADTIEVAISGQSGNCMKYTGSATSAVGFLTLSGGNGAVLTNLVVGQHYKLRIALKKSVFVPTITVACDAGSKAAIAPTTSWVVHVIEFIATGTAATITLTASIAPVATSILYVDYLELERVDGGYVMNLHDNGSAKGSVIFPEGSIPTADHKIVANYTYLLAAPGTHTTITGGEIADADYIANVAIVGNVSGKTHPVICIVKNAIADAGFSLASAPRDEAVPTIVFTGHFDVTDLDTEPWEVRWPNA